MKAAPKYYTEVAVIQATKGVSVIRASEIFKEELFPEEHLRLINQSHIYFICQRPRIRIISVTNNIDSEIVFVLRIEDKNASSEIEIKIPSTQISFEFKNIRITPCGTRFAFTDGNDDITALFPLEHLLVLAMDKTNDARKLEVVYIGQSFGKSGERSALERLKSHSTLQKILSSQASEFWWMETLVVLFVYDAPFIYSKMDGSGNPQIDGDKDFDHFQTIMSAPLSEAELITIAEASLIRYFQPFYNTHYKGCYPTSKPQHLKGAYRLDYSAIITEIDTEDVYMSIFSPTRKPLEHHTVCFDLHNPNDRLSFFESSAWTGICQDSPSFLDFLDNQSRQKTNDLDT